MKKLFTFLFFAVAAIYANAQTFEYEGLNYTILSELEKTCEVTENKSVVGDITIPRTVEYNGSQYSVTSIGDYAFYWCGLESVTLPENLISIGNNAFQSCSSLTSITLPESLISIGNYAFSICSSLTSITLPESLILIGNYAFSSCPSLTSITLPESLISIGNSAFSGCNSLTSITLPDGVTSIGNSAFSGCNSLTEINVADENKNFASIDGVLFSKDLTKLITYPGGKTGEYTVPNGVTSIGNSAFYDCSSLTSIKLPDSLISIGDYAFSWCILKSVTLPKNLTSIGYETFCYCNYLTSITLPASLTSIGEKAFSRCSSLTSINVENENKNYASMDGVLFSKDLTKLITYPGGKTGEYTVPNGITSIGNYAFYDCKNLNSIILPKSLASIGDYAFCSCSSLTSISLPEGVISIGDDAFYGCRSLTEITLSKSLTSIGDYAFSECRNLTSVTIPSGVISIGDNAFSNCYKLAEIFLNESLISIGDYAFSDCSSLTSISLPTGLASIGEYVFFYCTSLNEINVATENKYYASIGGVLFTKDLTALITCPPGKSGEYTVPNGVTLIGSSAFNYCLSLTSITLPESIISIKNLAFWGCGRLTTVNSYATNPPVCVDNYVFLGIPSDAVLHVPVGCKDDYASATGWSVFNTIIEDLDPAAVDDIETDSETESADDRIAVYNLQGLRMNVSRRSELPTLPTGIYIVNGKKILVK